MTSAQVSSSASAGANTSKAATSFGKLFVGQVPAVCTEEMLTPFFAPYGTLLEIKIMRDGSGRSKGCAWVRYETQAMAQAAIDALHEKTTVPPQTNTLQVRYAHNVSGGGNGGGGGGGGGVAKAGTGRPRNNNSAGGNPSGSGATGFTAQASSGGMDGSFPFQQPPFLNPYGATDPSSGYGGAYPNPSQPASAPLQTQNNPYASWQNRGGMGMGGGSFAFGSNGGSFGSQPANLSFPQGQVAWPQFQHQKMPVSPPLLSVFIGNLPLNISQEDLKLAITQRVPRLTITAFHVHHDRRFGFVTFDTPQAAQEAAKILDGMELQDKKCRAEVTQNAPKRQPRRSSGGNMAPGAYPNQQGGYGMAQDGQARGWNYQ